MLDPIAAELEEVREDRDYHQVEHEEHVNLLAEARARIDNLQSDNEKLTNAIEGERQNRFDSAKEWLDHTTDLENDFQDRIAELEADVERLSTERSRLLAELEEPGSPVGRDYQSAVSTWKERAEQAETKVKDAAIYTANVAAQLQTALNERDAALGKLAEHDCTQGERACSGAGYCTSHALSVMSSDVDRLLESLKAELGEE